MSLRHSLRSYKLIARCLEQYLKIPLDCTVKYYHLQFLLTERSEQIQQITIHLLKAIEIQPIIKKTVNALLVVSKLINSLYLSLTHSLSDLE